MNNGIQYQNEEKNVETNKWDVLLDLQKKIEHQAGRVGYFKSKTKTGNPSLEDPDGALASAELAFKELKEIYKIVANQ